MSLMDSGLYVRPGIGAAWPELKRNVQALLLDRTSKIAWVPSFFRADVVLTNAQNPDGIVLPTPALGATGQPVTDIPNWIDTAAKRQQWTQLAQDINNVIGQYAAGKQAAGAAALQQLVDNAAYWNKVGEAGKTVADATSAGLSRGVTILIVGAAVAGLGLWWWKDPAGFRAFFGKLIPGKG